MDLGTAPLFDLTAPAVEVDAPAAATRAEELLVSIRDRRATISEQEIGLVREIAEWATEHVVADEADASTLTERGWTRTVPGRKTELIFHINAADQTVARFGNTRTPIPVEQIKTWLGLTNTSVIVRAVLDLAGHQHVDSYEIPDRIRRQSSSATTTASIRIATDQPSPATSTTSSPTPKAAKPQQATSPRSAGATTG